MKKALLEQLVDANLAVLNTMEIMLGANELTVNQAIDCVNHVFESFGIELTFNIPAEIQDRVIQVGLR